MARSNSKDIRRPEDWFPPVNYNKPSLEDMDAAIAAAIAATFPIAESAVTGLVADLAAKVASTRAINTTAPITGGGTLVADRTIAISAATDAAAGSMSAADKTKLDAISGTNTGDQTSIVGITGTKAQFNTACTDGDFLYVGDVTQYTDEMARDTLGVALVAGTNITITVNDPGDTITIDATGGSSYTDEQAQDAIGAMIDSSLTYVDATPLLQRAALTGDITAPAGSNATTIAAGVVTLAKQADMATASVVYRKTAGVGAPEVNTLATLKTDLGLTGTNSGDQTITLTGDINGSGTGSFAATIGNSKVTLAKIANASANSKLLGSGAAGSGTPYAEITLGTGLSMSGTTLNGSATATAAATPTIVQTVSVCDDSVAGAVTFGVAPTAGNLLVAIGTKWSSAAAATTGWIQPFNEGTQTDDIGFIFYKTAAAGESTTQTFSTTVSGWGAVVFEIAGSGPNGLLTYFADGTLASSSSAAANIGVPKDNCLGIGLFMSQLRTNPTLTISGATTIASASDTTVANGGPRTLSSMSQSLNKGAWQPSCSYTSSGINGYAVLVLGGVI